MGENTRLMPKSAPATALILSRWVRASLIHTVRPVWIVIWLPPGTGIGRTVTLHSAESFPVAPVPWFHPLPIVFHHQGRPIPANRSSAELLHGKKSLRKIRHCFFNADELKVVNCMSASVAAQHIEASLDVNNNHTINQCGFCCQD